MNEQDALIAQEFLHRLSSSASAAMTLLDLALEAQSQGEDPTSYLHSARESLVALAGQINRRRRDLKPE